MTSEGSRPDAGDLSDKVSRSLEQRQLTVDAPAREHLTQAISAGLELLLSRESDNGTTSTGEVGLGFHIELLVERIAQVAESESITTLSDESFALIWSRLCPLYPWC